jgi:hypothetical protein
VEEEPVLDLLESVFLLGVPGEEFLFFELHARGVFICGASIDGNGNGAMMRGNN